MPHARSRRNAAEACIGEHRDMLAVRQSFQRGCHLINLLHAGALGPAADQHNHIAVTDDAALDCLDRGCFRNEYARGTAMPKDSLPIHKRRINCRALDNRALGRKIANRETHRRREAALPGTIPAHNHIVRIDAVQLLQLLPYRTATFAVFPPVETRTQRLAAHSSHALIQKPGRTQCQHHLGYASGKKHLHGCKTARPVGKRIDKARHFAIHFGPLRHRRPSQSCRKRNCRQMNQQIRRSPKGRVQHHRIAHRARRQHVAHAHLLLMHAHERPRRALGRIEPHRLP